MRTFSWSIWISENLKCLGRNIIHNYFNNRNSCRSLDENHMLNCYSKLLFDNWNLTFIVSSLMIFKKKLWKVAVADPGFPGKSTDLVEIDLHDLLKKPTKVWKSGFYRAKRKEKLEKRFIKKSDGCFSGAHDGYAPSARSQYTAVAKCQGLEVGRAVKLVKVDNFPLGKRTKFKNGHFYRKSEK